MTNKYDRTGSPLTPEKGDTFGDTWVLGKTAQYVDQYAPHLLYPLSRQPKRLEIGLNVEKELPFIGHDLWTGYEISWLNGKGKPQVAIATFQFSAKSPALIESKSFKLYLNSFNNSKFAHALEVQNIIAHDLSRACGADVMVNFYSMSNQSDQPSLELRRGFLDASHSVDLDQLDVECNLEAPSGKSLITVAGDENQYQIFVSDLLKSNCLVTGQPDWGSVRIALVGPKLNPETLLRYIVSFRNHNEFHEQCVERIFMDILNNCKPTLLSVCARYTRRGGLDINPYRVTALPLHSALDKPIGADALAFHDGEQKLVKDFHRWRLIRQ